MDEHALSRRTVLGCCGVAAGIAGCLGDGDDSADGLDVPDDDSADGSDARDDHSADGSDARDDHSADGSDVPDDDLPGLFELAGDGTDAFAGWLAPETTVPGDDSERLYIYQDYVASDELGYEPNREQREQVASAFGSEPETLDGELLIGLPDGGNGSLHVGAFDADAVRETVEAELGEPTDEYEGYTVYGGELAVGEDAVILTPEYEQFVDAKHGGGAHLADDEDVELLLALQPAGFQLSATRRENEGGLAVSGTSFLEVDDEGAPTRAVRTFIFESSEEASVERAEEIAASGEYEETRTAERHGRVVMLEYDR